MENDCQDFNADHNIHGEAEETKRKTRNMSEKKRRDQFNTLIDELSIIVSPNDRKMNKSMVLKTAINNLKSYDENFKRSKEFQLNEVWKPSFITNEEYSFLMLQSIGALLIVFSSCGRILYASNNLAFILGYGLDEVLSMNIYDIISEDDRAYLENSFFFTSIDNQYPEREDCKQLRFNCRFVRKSSLDTDKWHEPAEFIGQIKTEEKPCSSHNDEQQALNKSLIFVGAVRFTRQNLFSEITLQNFVKTEFISHHNFEWKFLFLDERAPSIIGYSSFELLGTSGYNFYHIEDLENIIVHHEYLMTQGEGVSGCYRFLTKGQEWIWLETTSYINRRQLNSEIEFIVCTHKIVNPLKPKNETTVLEKRLDDISSSASSSTGSYTGNYASEKASSYSWHSTTSESNCETDDQWQQNYEGYCPEDTSASSSSSSREHHSMKCTIYRKVYRQHRSTPRMKYTITTNNSSNSPCFQFNNTFQYSQSENSTSTNYTWDTQSSGSGRTDYTGSSHENSWQQECTELRGIIADRTEELRIVSEELHTIRKANQQKEDSQYDPQTNVNTTIVSKSKIDACMRRRISVENQERRGQYAAAPLVTGQVAMSADSRLNHNNQGPGWQNKQREHLPKHPPLKYFIEGKVKLTDMISPGKIRKGKHRHKSKAQKYIGSEPQKVPLEPVSLLSSSHLHYTTRIISEEHQRKN